jgi:hypothetical protein
MILSSGQRRGQPRPPNRSVYDVSTVMSASRPLPAGTAPTYRNPDRIQTLQGWCRSRCPSGRSRFIGQDLRSRREDELVYCEDLPASAEALQSRPRAAKIVLGWLLCAAPPVKSRRRQIVNPTWGLAARMRLARIQTSALGGLRRPVRHLHIMAGWPSERERRSAPRPPEPESSPIRAARTIPKSR